MKKKRYSEEKIIQILHEAERGEQPISEICRKHQRQASANRAFIAGARNTVECRWMKFAIYAN